MAPISTTTEVDRPPEEVFTYVTDPSRFVEWQRNVVSGHMDTDGLTTVGTKCVTTRRIGFAERAVTAEITHIAPPRTWGCVESTVLSERSSASPWTRSTRDGGRG